jgi:hypothetical protein
MASESRTPTVFTEPRVSCEEEKEGEEEKGSETLEGSPVVKDFDPPSPSDEFPDGGLTAWTTAFGV